MFRINFTLPVVTGLTYFLDEKYKPDAIKILEKGLQPTKELSYTGFWRMRAEDMEKYEKRFHEKAVAEKQKNVEELTCVGERLTLAFATHQIAKQLKKLPIFSSRPLLADCFCLGLQSTLSLPSTLFSLAHKTFIHPIVPNTPKNIPQFYVREFYDFKGADVIRSTRTSGEKKPFWYKPEPDMHQYFSTKLKCRPVLFLAGFISSLFLLSTTVRTNLQRDNEDQGLLEGKNGFFHQFASKVANWTSHKKQIAQDMLQYFAKTPLPTKIKLKSVPISLGTVFLKTNSDFFITQYKEMQKSKENLWKKLANPIDLKYNIYGKTWTRT